MKYVDLLGNMAGITGLLVCLVAGVSPPVGADYLMGFQPLVLLAGGLERIY